MDNLYSFDEPLNKEPDGTYITAAQMRFFLNREDGIKLYEDKSDIFTEYYDICRVYNLISNIMKEDKDAAILYWDEKAASVSMAFPDEGKAATALDKIKPHYIVNEEDEEDGDDPWGLQADGPSWRD